jgi:hypothetical protein
VNLQPKSDAMLPVSAVDSVRYTKDLLANLRRMAVGQDQLVLAGLLDAASREADRLLRETAQSH